MIGAAGHADHREPRVVVEQAAPRSRPDAQAFLQQVADRLGDDVLHLPDVVASTARAAGRRACAREEGRRLPDHVPVAAER